MLEWLHDPPADPKEAILTIQDVDKDGIKYFSHDKTESNWVAPDGPLRVPQSNLDLLDFEQSTGTSMDIFVPGVGVGLPETKNLIIKKLKLARETGELETEGENAKKPPFRRIFESYFDLPKPSFKQYQHNGPRYRTHGTYMRYSDNRGRKLQNSTSG